MRSIKPGGQTGGRTNALSLAVPAGGELADYPVAPLVHAPTPFARRRVALLAVAAVTMLAAFFAVRLAAVAYREAAASAPGGVSASTAPAAPEPGAVDRRAPADAPAASDVEVYVVQPGDTLWSLAGRIAGDGDRRPIVDALVASLGGARLEVGQRVTLSR